MKTRRGISESDVYNERHEKRELFEAG